MKIKSTYLSAFYTRHTIVVLALLFVLFSSCPIKMGIKSFMGVPAKMEQPNSNRATVSPQISQEICSSFDKNEVSITQKTSLLQADWHDFAMLAAFVLFFLALTIPKVNSHPDYSTVRISGPIPLFLQQRKLII